MLIILSVSLDICDCDGIIREDHFVFFSEDKTKDPWFVELCNVKIMEFYAENSVVVKHDIEFTDGCGSQFKSIKSFKMLTERSIPTTRIFRNIPWKEQE